MYTFWEKQIGKYLDEHDIFAKLMFLNLSYSTNPTRLDEYLYILECRFNTIWIKMSILA